MSAVWARVRAELRSGLRGLVTLAVLLGLVGGVAAASAAAARRTDTAYARFIASTKPPEAFVLSAPPGLRGFPTVDLRRVARLPQVLESRVGTGLIGVGLTTSNDVLWHGELNIQELVGPGSSGKLLGGRLPRAPNEIAVGYRASQDPRVQVGGRMHIALARRTASFYRAVSGSLRRSDFLPPVTVRIVGVVLLQGELQGSADVLVPRSFVSAHQAGVLAFHAAACRLRHGLADFPAFSRAVDHLSPGAFVYSIEDESTFVNRSTHLLAISMWLFAALAAVAGLLIFGQALVRRTFEESTENPRLRSLGMTGRQLFGVGMARALLVGVGGAVVALLLAFLVSPVAPLGRLARVAEPHPGFMFDPVVLPTAAVLAVVLSALVGAVPAWAASRVRGDPLGSALVGGAARPSVVAGGLARAGFPPTAVAGVRLALEPGRGRTATPVRSAVVGAILSIAAIATAATFATSFGHLLETPRLYGLGWDVNTGNPFAGPELGKRVVPALRRDPAIDGIAAAAIRDFVQIRGARVNAWGIEPVRGHVHPTVAEGRWPRSPTEIALGTKTLEAAGASIGDTITVTKGAVHARMRVVGRSVFPDVGFGPGLGEGAGMTLEGLRRLVPKAVANGFAMTLEPGVDLQAEIRKLNREFGRYGSDAGGPAEGTELKNLRTIEGLPLLLAGLLALSAAAAVAHMLVTSVRRRRRDLAILKTLGFVRRQVSATVAWQATTVAVVALAVGLPVGLAVGRWTWSFFADQLGVIPAAVVGAASTLLVVPAVILVGNLIAAVPGRLAARTGPAQILRAE